MQETAAHPGVSRIDLSAALVLLPVIVLAIVVTWTIAAIVPLGAALCFLPFTILCAVPGVVLARRLYRRATASWLFALLIGPVWGYALSSLPLLALWVAGVRRPIWFVLAPVATAIVCRFVPPLGSAPAPRDSETAAAALSPSAPGVGATASAAPAGADAWPLAGIRIPTLTRADVAAVCLTLLLVPLVVGRPYARVGERQPDGEAWRAYFTADFVWAMAVVAEVSKGDVPPHNPYRIGSELHYYWLAHLVPSLEHRATAGQTTIRQLLLANAVLSGLAFIGFFYLFVRHFVDSPAAAAVACAAAVLFHSFEGIEELIALWRLGAPLALVQYLNIDAVTRWIYHSMPVDGLQRLLLYQPQHQLGYVMGFSALLLLIQVRQHMRIGVMALAGLFISLNLLLSTFSALMIASVAALFEGLRMMRARQFVWMVPCALAALAPIAGAVALGQRLRYVEYGGPLVSLMVNPMAWHRAPLAIFLSFGALLIGALAGGIAIWRRRTQARFGLLAAIIAICWFFYFFVDVRDHQHVYVGWRAGHLLFVAFAALSGYALQECWRAGGRVRTAGVTAAVLLVAASAPTAAIDLYNTQDTSNREEAPGFRWTLVLPTDEVEALTWIREHTPASAIVQVDPEVRDPETWAYIPAFAERRMAAGLPISMIPLNRYQRATARILKVFKAETADAAYVQALDAGIDYLMIAPPERRRYPELESRLDNSPFLWPLAFRNNTVSIYAVARAH